MCIGGEPISHFTIESKDTQKGFTREDKYEFKPAKLINDEGVELGDRAFANAIEKSLTFTVKNLIPQTYYQLRSKDRKSDSEFTERLKSQVLNKARS